MINSLDNIRYGNKYGGSVQLDRNCGCGHGHRPYDSKERTVKVLKAQVADVVDRGGGKSVVRVKTEGGGIYETIPISQDLLIGLRNGFETEINLVINGNDSVPSDQFILLCAFGGPIGLGICLTVALVLISAPAF